MVVYTVFGHPYADVQIGTCRQHSAEVLAHHASDPTRSKPYHPWHHAHRLITPEASEQNQSETVANLFPKSPAPTGPPLSPVRPTEYVTNHICSTKTVLHKICHDRARPSHLLLPAIPE